MKTIFAKLNPFDSSGLGGRVRFSPDGQQLAMADNHRIVMWHLQSTKNPVLLNNANAAPNTLEFSPAGDQIMTGNADGTVRWSDTASRQMVKELSPGSGGGLFVAWSADGARFVSGGGASLKLFGYPGTNLLQSFGGISNQITAVAISADGSKVLAATSDKQVLVWNSGSVQPLLRLTGHSGLITTAGIYPGGSNAFTSSLDGTIRGWDLVQGIETFRSSPKGPMVDAMQSQDGSLIVACDNGNPGSAVVLDAASGAMVRAFSDSPVDFRQMKGVAISPDNTMLATTHSDGRVQLWDTELTPKPSVTVVPLAFGTNVPVTLRSHGLYYFSVDSEAGKSFLVTLETNAAPPQSLALLSKSAGGSLANVALPDEPQFANLASSTIAVDSSFALKSLKPPPSLVDVTGLRMVAIKGRLPSEYDYDTFAQASLTNLHCEMPVVALSGERIYVLAFSPYLAAGSINAHIRLEYSSFHLSSAFPAKGGNSGNVTVKIQGTGISSDTAATLVRGSNVITGQLTSWADPTKAWFTFPLSNAPVGLYSLQISKPGFVPAVLTDGFEVVTAIGPLLQASISAPASIRPNREYSLTLEYANTGDVDIAAPLFVVGGADENNQPVLYVPGAGGVVDQVSSVQILGVNQEGPVGILPPGSRVQVPFTFRADGRSHALVNFNLSVLKADNTPMNWTSIELNLRPAGIADDVWNALWNNFKATIGTTWADYLRALDNQAYLMALEGQPTSDANVLLQGLFTQASGSPFRRTLAASVDAQATAPGLPLAFGRSISDSLDQRFAIGPLGRGWSHNFEYSLTQPTNNLVVIRTPGGGARSFVLAVNNDWLGQVGDYAKLTSSGGAFTLTELGGARWQFNNSGQLVALNDLNGNQISLTYDGGLLTNISHSAGPYFTLQYNFQNRLAQLTDQAGQITSYEYDASGEHLLRAISPGSVTNAYAYLSVSNTPSDHALTSVTFPDQTHQYFGWDTLGRLAQQSRDGGTELAQFTYNPGSWLSVRDASNAVTSVRVGSLGQMVQMTDPLGRTMTFSYDANLNLVQQIGPAGEASTMSYDHQGNATNVINPLGQSVALNYGNLNRLFSLTDAKSQPMGFGYNTNGNLTQMNYADTSAESFAYDTLGSVTNWTNRRGQTIQFIRNGLGQLTHKAYPDGHTIDYAYDLRGLLTNITDSVQGSTRMAFDARSFLTNILYPDGKGFAFAYNAAGQRTRRTGTDGYFLTYGYDVAGRLQSLSNSAGLLVQYAYDGNGRLAGETKGNGTSTSYHYDAAGQVLSLTNFAPGGAVQSFFNYLYDTKGNRRSMTTTVGVTSYDYDALNQLTNVSYPGGRVVAYAYDPAGNRTVVNDSGTNTIYTANALNEYTQAGGTTFGYDADGNLTNRTDETGTTTYQFDTENRLVSVSTPTNGVWQYNYDAMGNRVAVIHDGVTNRYLHDPIGLVDVAAEYDGVGALVARYDHALGLVARVDGAGNAGFYSFDALGSTREITSSGGSLLNSYEYDPNGSYQLQIESIPNAFGFCGRYGVVQEKSGLFLMRSRFYCDSIGRFINVDPIRLGGGMNLYAYAENNPINSSDVFGLKPSRPPYFKQLPKPRSRILGPVCSVEDANGPQIKWPAIVSTPDLYVNADGSVLKQGALDPDYGMVLQIVGDKALEEGLERILIGAFGKKWGLRLSGAVGYLFELLDGTDIAPDGAAFETVESGGNHRYWRIKINNNLSHQITSSNVLSTIQSILSEIVRPQDPNDKIGPVGIGPNRVVSTNETMEYMIRFENATNASAPVQELVVVDYLDQNLDWTSVQFEQIGYGDRIVTPVAGVQSFLLTDGPTNSNTFIGSGASKMAIKISGSVNSQNGRVEWRMVAMDTNTLTYPLDALTGFLPPEDGTGRGNGYLRFSVKPNASTPIGTSITNTASIIFDSNESIDTPPVWNIISDVPSLTATIAYLPAQIMAGSPFTYTLGITNNGSSTVTNVVLTNALPAGFNIVSNYVTTGTLLLTNGVWTWNVGILSNGVSAQWFITAMPSAPGTFTNYLTYSGGSGLAQFVTTDLISVYQSNPPLRIQLNGDQVELYWPTNFSGFQIQQTDELISPEWFALTNTPAIFGQEYRATLDRPAAKAFFRLFKP